MILVVKKWGVVCCLKEKDIVWYIYVYVMKNIVLDLSRLEILCGVIDCYFFVV